MRLQAELTEAKREKESVMGLLDNDSRVRELQAMISNIIVSKKEPCLEGGRTMDLLRLIGERGLRRELEEARLS